MTPPTQACGISWLHTDHEWTDGKGKTWRCPGVWPIRKEPRRA